METMEPAPRRGLRGLTGRSRSLRRGIPILIAGAATMSLCFATLAQAPIAGALARNGNAVSTMVAVKAATVAKYGKILEDQSGLPLYYYTKDKAPNLFACTGDCLTAWPALLLPKGQSKPKVGAGVTGISSVKSPQGVQVTWNGKPLYTFFRDSKGVVKGQGVGKVWYVVQLAAVHTTSASSGGW